MSFFPPSARVELRHQIAAVIDPSLAVSVEPKTAVDVAKAAAYNTHRKATKITSAGFVDGAALPTDNLFNNWVNSGSPVIASAALPDFIISLVTQFLNQTGTNQKGG